MSHYVTASDRFSSNWLKLLVHTVRSIVAVNTHKVSLEFLLFRVPHVDSGASRISPVVAHLVSWPSVVKDDWTRLVLFCCILRCLLLGLYLVCVFSCCTVLFVSISQVIGCENRLRNDLDCIGWGVKLYANFLFCVLPCYTAIPVQFVYRSRPIHAAKWLSLLN